MQSAKSRGGGRLCLFCLLPTAYCLLLAIVMLVASGALVLQGSTPPATQPRPIAISDLTGTQRHPLDLGTAKAAVVIFIATECPVSNGYAPEINRIRAAYHSKGVTFYLVHADPDLSVADAARHAKAYGYACPVLIDRRHELVRRLGATITPQAFVIGQGGNVRYRGRIDNLYVSLGRKRYQATVHDLREALDAVLAGKPVPAPRTDAVGCSISD